MRVPSSREELVQQRIDAEEREFIFRGMLGKIVDALDNGDNPEKLIVKAKKLLGRE